MTEKKIPTFKQWMSNFFSQKELFEIAQNGLCTTPAFVPNGFDAQALYSAYHSEIWEVLGEDARVFASRSRDYKFRWSVFFAAQKLAKQLIGELPMAA